LRRARTTHWRCTGHCTFNLCQAIDRVAQLGPQKIDIYARFREQATNGAALLVKERNHDVYRLDELVILANRERLRLRKRHLKLACQFVQTHVKTSCRSSGSRNSL